jgi:hypothetical protein
MIDYDLSLPELGVESSGENIHSAAVALTAAWGWARLRGRFNDNVYFAFKTLPSFLATIEK